MPVATTPGEKAAPPTRPAATVPPTTTPVDRPVDAAPYLARRDGSADIAAYAAALDALEPICVESRAQLAGLADLGKGDLDQNGNFGENRLTILQHLLGFIGQAPGRVDCQERLLAYLVIRETG